MKRYRATNFFIDCIRNQPDKDEIKKYIIQRYGDLHIDEKLSRYLSFKPPSLHVLVEYHRLLREIEDSFIHGLYYPCLTSACCLGERIFNIIILKLRNYYKRDKHYKHIYRKDSFDDWSKAIAILCDWKVIDSEDIAKKYNELKDVRHEVIHFSKLEDVENKALAVLKIIYDITSYFFAVGDRKDIYFWGQGEIYIRKEAEQIPFVKEMIIPHCFLVGHKHRVESRNGQMCIHDSHVYEEKEINDDEFAMLRKNGRG